MKNIRHTTTVSMRIDDICDVRIKKWDMNILKWILIETYNTDHLMFVKLCHHHSNRWNVLHKCIENI